MINVFIIILILILTIPLFINILIKKCYKNAKPFKIVNYKKNINYDIEILSKKSPYLIKVNNFLSEYECDYLIKKETNNMLKSKSERKIFNNRISESSIINYSNNILDNINKRLEDLINFPINQSENYEIIKYNIGGHYGYHFDLLMFNKFKNYNQRVISVIIYLNTVDSGGETHYYKPKIIIKPVKGTAVICYNCYDTGYPDFSTLHSGFSVINGEKWILTKFFWN